MFPEENANIELSLTFFEELKNAERTGQEYTNQIQQQGSPTEFKGDAPPNMHP